MEIVGNTSKKIKNLSSTSKSLSEPSKAYQEQKKLVQKLIQDNNNNLKKLRRYRAQLGCPNLELNPPPITSATLDFYRRLLNGKNVEGLMTPTEYEQMNQLSLRLLAEKVAANNIRESFDTNKKKILGEKRVKEEIKNQ